MAIFNGTTLGDTINGTSGDDVISGFGGDDSLRGNAGNDTLYGDAGFDILQGGDGNDILMDSADGAAFQGDAGDDQLIGSASLADQASYFFFFKTSGVTFVSTFVPGAVTSTQADGLGGIDTLTNIDTLSITGSQFDDNLVGDASNNFINGFSGNDTLSGKAGNDFLLGFDGDDALTGGSGNDTIDGGSGNDTAVFSGLASEYVMTYQSAKGEYTITDSQANRDGTDTLTTIEYLKFSDGIKTPASLLQGNAPTYTLTPSATSVNEGTSLTYTLNTTNIAAGTVLNYTISGVSAADVVGGALTGSVTVAATGVTTFTVALAADKLTEGAETLVAKVSSAGAATLATANGVVVNDTSISSLTSPVMTLSSNSASILEGNTASQALTFTVNLSAASSSAVSVNYATANGTATAGSDYTATSGVLTFAAGETSKTVAVSVLGDTVIEANETFTLNLSNPTGATLGSVSSTIATIVNDDSIQPVGSSHTNVYISATTPQAFTIADSGMSLFGGSSREVITINAGVNTVKLNQNIDRVNLPGASSSFTFKQAGNQLVVYDSLGANVIVTLPLQGDADGTQIGFGNGVFNAKLSSGVMSLGGAVVNPSAPTGVNPATLTSTLEPTPSSSSSASAYLQPNDVITIANSGVKVFGSSGAEALTLTSATNGIVFDQNMDRINLPGSHSNYKFLQTGNQINIYDALGTTLIARGPVQSDGDGTLLSFDNGVGSVLISGGVMRLGGSVVSTSTPSAITSSVFTNSGLVAVSGSGSGSAAGGDVTYTLAMGNYAYSISGFGPGDKIVSPTGVTPTLVNDSFTDGSVTIQSASAGQTVQITLTGLTSAQDAALNSVLDLNTLFGVGTVV